MFKLKLKTDKVIRRLNTIPVNIRENVKDQSYKIRDEIGETTAKYVPKWQPLLYKTYKSDINPYSTSHFYGDDGDLKMTLSYDAWNPRTGFHYARLRYYNNTSGSPRWLEIGMKESQPLVEKTMITAVQKGIKQVRSVK